MELREALTEQYHAGLAMLAECVAKCPDNVWQEGKYPRAFWRIAFHAVYFTHLYLGQDEESYQPWPARREGLHSALWNRPWEVEPFELPNDVEIYRRQEILEYIRFVDEIIDATIDQMDLAADVSGFSWYKNIGKLSHQLMNLRHLQGHVGQLSERLMEKGVDTNWVAKSEGRQLQ
ncbi:MAG: hypothetical protein P4L33_19250 [Capsulimonadaceae bacterium]|nr:hypothetical protein [Capsulimonadaceae bacterium]